MSIENTYKELLKITEEEKKEISDNTPKVLPLEPTAQGWKPSLIRQKQWQGICGDSGSVLALLEKKYGVIDTYIEEEIVRFNELTKNVEQILDNHNCIDMLLTKEDLDKYENEDLLEGNKIVVMRDKTQNNVTTIYSYNGGEWEFYSTYDIGSYTREEIDKELETIKKENEETQEALENAMYWGDSEFGVEVPEDGNYVTYFYDKNGNKIDMTDLYAMAQNIQSSEGILLDDGVKHTDIEEPLNGVTYFERDGLYYKKYVYTNGEWIQLGTGDADISNLVSLTTYETFVTKTNTSISDLNEAITSLKAEVDNGVAEDLEAFKIQINGDLETFKEEVNTSIEEIEKEIETTKESVEDTNAKQLILNTFLEIEYDTDVTPDERGNYPIKSIKYDKSLEDLAKAVASNTSAINNFADSSVKLIVLEVGEELPNEDINLNAIYLKPTDSGNAYEQFRYDDVELKWVPLGTTEANLDGYATETYVLTITDKLSATITSLENSLGISRDSNGDVLTNSTLTRIVALETNSATKTELETLSNNVVTNATFNAQNTTNANTYATKEELNSFESGTNEEEVKQIVEDYINEQGGVGGSYSLPIATSSTLGGVRVDSTSNIKIDSSGRIDVYVTQGEDGLSAYEVWKIFMGKPDATEEEYIESLKVKGDTGYNNYELAVENGFVGSVDDFISTFTPTVDDLVYLDGTPIGTIQHFYRDTAPLNYLPMDGRTVLKADYPAYYSFCEKHAPSLVVNFLQVMLPTCNDGRFLRGLGYSGVEYLTLASTTGTTVTDSVGDLREGKVKRWYGQVDAGYNSSSYNTSSGVAYRISGTGGAKYSGSDYQFGIRGLDIQRQQLTTANDIRPNYMAVGMYIKVKNDISTRNGVVATPVEDYIYYLNDMIMINGKFYKCVVDTTTWEDALTSDWQEVNAGVTENEINTLIDDKTSVILATIQSMQDTITALQARIDELEGNNNGNS